MYFFLYSKLRTWALEALNKKGKALTGDIGVGPSLLVAFLAGCGNVLITNPIWVVSTRMQARSPGLQGCPCCQPAAPSGRSCAQTCSTSPICKCGVVGALHQLIDGAAATALRLATADRSYKAGALVADRAPGTQAHHKQAEKEGGTEPGPIATGREIVAESGVLVRLAQLPAPCALSATCRQCCCLVWLPVLWCSRACSNCFGALCLRPGTPCAAGIANSW